MGRKEKASYVAALRPRYLRSSREQKSKILDEMSATLGCHRKAAIRLIRPRKRPKRPGGRVGRPSLVTASDVQILERVVVLCDWPCGKRLQAMLPLWLGHDEAAQGGYAAGQRERLLSLSPATLDRHLAPARKRAGIKGRCGTKPGSLLKTEIPLRTGPWEVDTPGYLEADTVAHCGASMGGEFAWTLTATDIVTTWTENRAVWHKQKTGVREAVEDIDQSLPFTIRGLDCDNGSEFINRTLVHYLAEHPDTPCFTRSRPYHKNDNAHVEQKNWTHVRQLYGYGRIDNKDCIEAMNALYRTEWSQLQNFFKPTMKCIEKVRVGAKIVKRYDRPKTPLARLLDSGVLSDAQAAQYRALAASLNPIKLRDTIRTRIREITNIASVTPLVRQ